MANTTPAPAPPLNLVLIVSVSAAGVVVILILIILVCLCERKKEKRRSRLTGSNAKAMKSGHSNTGFEELDETNTKSKRADDVHVSHKEVLTNGLGNQDIGGNNGVTVASAKTSIPTSNGISKDSKQKTDSSLQGGMEPLAKGVVAPTKKVHQKSTAGKSEEVKRSTIGPSDDNNNSNKSETILSVEKNQYSNEGNHLSKSKVGSKSSGSFETVNQPQQNSKQDSNPSYGSNIVYQEKTPATASTSVQSEASIPAVETSVLVPKNTLDSPSETTHREGDLQNNSSEKHSNDVNKTGYSRNVASCDTVPSGNVKCIKVQDNDTGEVTCKKVKYTAPKAERTNQQEYTDGNLRKIQETKTNDDGVKIKPSVDDDVCDQKGTVSQQKEQNEVKTKIDNDDNHGKLSISDVTDQQGTGSQQIVDKPRRGDIYNKSKPYIDNVPDQQENAIQLPEQKVKNKRSTGNANIKDTEVPDIKEMAHARQMLEELQRKNLDVVKQTTKPVLSTNPTSPSIGGEKSPVNTGPQPAESEKEIYRYSPPRKKKVNDRWPLQREALGQGEGNARLSMEAELQMRLQASGGMGLKAGPGVNRHKGPVKRKSYEGVKN